MLERGFKKIGKSFPVFCPDTGEEYALARTEKKQGSGHSGFEISASADITLYRIYQGETSRSTRSRYPLTASFLILITASKIYQKVLRHVNEAFVEDPLDFSV